MRDGRRTTTNERTIEDRATQPLKRKAEFRNQVKFDFCHDRRFRTFLTALQKNQQHI